MIPNREQCIALFDRFNLPSQKRIHVEMVAALALYLSKKLAVHNLPAGEAGSKFEVNERLLEAAALLHDIDKNIPKIEGERHPDTAVRVLTELGMPEIAKIVKSHSVHCILSPDTVPSTWEEKLLFLSDKMVKYEVIGVDHRFKLWYKENLPTQAVNELNQAFPKVKALEQEVLQMIGLSVFDIQKDLNK